MKKTSRYSGSFFIQFLYRFYKTFYEKGFFVYQMIN